MGGRCVSRGEQFPGFDNVSWKKHCDRLEPVDPRHNQPDPFCTQAGACMGQSGHRYRIDRNYPNEAHHQPSAATSAWPARKLACGTAERSSAEYCRPQRSACRRRLRLAPPDQADTSSSSGRASWIAGGVLSDHHAWACQEAMGDDSAGSTSAPSHGDRSAEGFVASCHAQIARGPGCGIFLAWFVTMILHNIHYAKLKGRPMREPEPPESFLWVALWAGLALALVAAHGAGSGTSAPTASASCAMTAC